LIFLLEIAQRRIDFSNANAMTLDTAKLLPAHGIRLIELDIGKVPMCNFAGLFT